MSAREALRVAICSSSNSSRLTIADCSCVLIFFHHLCLGMCSPEDADLRSRSRAVNASPWRSCGKDAPALNSTAAKARRWPDQAGTAELQQTSRVLRGLGLFGAPTKAYEHQPCKQKPLPLPPLPGIPGRRCTAPSGDRACNTKLSDSRHQRSSTLCSAPWLLHDQTC